MEICRVSPKPSTLCYYLHGAVETFIRQSIKNIYRPQLGSNYGQGKKKFLGVELYGSLIFLSFSIKNRLLTGDRMRS